LCCLSVRDVAPPPFCGKRFWQIGVPEGGKDGFPSDA
jgi:hypothetical protein